MNGEDEVINDFLSGEKYKRYSREDLKEMFHYEDGILYSRSSGEALLSKNSKGHLVVGVRRNSINVTLQQRYVVYLMEKGYVPVHPYSLGYRDFNPENISIGNLVVIPPGRGVKMEEPIHKGYDLVEEGIYYSEYDGLYSVRRGKNQSVYLTPVLDEARFIYNEWKSDRSLSRPDRFQWERYKNLGLIMVKSPKLDKTCVWHLYNKPAENYRV